MCVRVRVRVCVYVCVCVGGCAGAGGCVGECVYGSHESSENWDRSLKLSQQFQDRYVTNRTKYNTKMTELR
jgi:hypothetical protein